MFWIKKSTLKIQWNVWLERSVILFFSQRKILRWKRWNFCNKIKRETKLWFPAVPSTVFYSLEKKKLSFFSNLLQRLLLILKRLVTNGGQITNRRVKRPVEDVTNISLYRSQFSRIYIYYPDMRTWSNSAGEYYILYVRIQIGTLVLFSSNISTYLCDLYDCKKGRRN